MKITKKISIFMSALMLCSVCGAALPDRVSVFAEETGSQETLDTTANDNQLISESSKEFDFFNSKTIEDLCLNKKTICENGNVVISIPFTDSLGAFSYNSEFRNKDGVFSQCAPRTVNNNEYYILHYHYDKAVDDVITITNDITQETYTYAVTENGTKLNEVSHTEAQRNIADIEAIFANKKTKEEFCLNSGTYIKDGLFVVGREAVRNFGSFMETRSTFGFKPKCHKSETIQIGDKYYFIGVFSFNEDGAVDMSCTYHTVNLDSSLLLNEDGLESNSSIIQPGPSVEYDIYYKVSDNGTKIEEITETQYKKLYHDIPEYVPYSDEEIIEFCENTKVLYKDGMLMLGFVDSDETWYGYSKILECTGHDMCEHDGKYYYVTYFNIPDGVKVNIPSDAADLNSEELFKEVLGLPEYMPISSDEICDFCENTKVVCKDGVLLTSIITGEENYRGLHIINNLNDINNDYSSSFWCRRDGKYYMVLCFDSLKDGIFGIWATHDGYSFVEYEDEDNAFYEISDNCNSIKEITYSDAYRTIEGIPDIVPYGRHEVEDFVKNTKMACKDGVFVLSLDSAPYFSKMDYYTGLGDDIDYKEWDRYSCTSRVSLYYFENIEDGIYNCRTYEGSKYLKISDNGNAVEEVKFTDLFEAGDIDGNGVTDLTDLSWLSLYLIGDKDLSGYQIFAADVTGDGIVDIRDLPTLKQYICKDPDTVLKKIESEDDFKYIIR